MKTTAPVVGFNHNVKYADRVYHVQTEDSGLPHAHFITHLFLGGNIVASTKSSYAERAGEVELPKIVRQLMETQHKGMLRRLVAGEFNELAERLSTPHYEPGVLATGQTGPAAVNTPGAAPVAATQPLAPAPTRPASPPPAKAPPGVRPAAPPPPATPIPFAKPQAPSVSPLKPPPIWRPAPPTASPRLPGGPLPSTTRMPSPQGKPGGVPQRLAPAAPATPRPAAAAPSLFADAAPAEASHDDLPTLFAEELISEKSLDEVILAFLSADLEPPK